MGDQGEGAVEKALQKKFDDLQTQLAQAQKDGAKKEDLLKLHKQIEKQGNIIEDFIEQNKKKVVKDVLGQFVDFVNDKKDEIKSIYEKGSGSIEFIPKAVGDISTGSGVNVGTVPNTAVASPSNISLRNDADLLNLAKISETSSPSFSYTETVPKEGGYDYVDEGAVKPQIDFKWETRFTGPKKVAAYEVLSEESVTDVVRLRSIAENYLKDAHDLFKSKGIYMADGTGNNPTGATVAARTFIVGSMLDKFPNGSTNFMDVVNAVITDIYTNRPYADAQPFKPNVVLVSPIDFFVEFVAAKDANGLPLYPQAGLFNSVSIGGVTIKPWIEIPAGKIFVADMKKYNVVNYIPFSIRLGWINNQFITNEFTMVGESRFFQYIKNLDLGAFVYDDIAVVKTAIEAV